MHDRECLWASNVAFVVRLQARLRGFLVRQELAARRHILQEQHPAAVRIQVTQPKPVPLRCTGVQTTGGCLQHPLVGLGSSGLFNSQDSPKVLQRVVRGVILLPAAALGAASLLYGLPENPAHVAVPLRRSWELVVFSHAQACWRGYKQRRAYLERLRYLRANADAAIKVWKTLSLLFAPFLLSNDHGDCPLPSTEAAGGNVAAGRGHGLGGAGAGGECLGKTRGFLPFAPTGFGQASPSSIQLLEHLSQIQAAVRMWQARRRYRERLHYFRQNVSDGRGRRTAAPGSVSPSAGGRGTILSAGGRNCCILVGGQMGRKRCLVGLEAKLSSSVKCEERKRHSSSIKTHEGFRDPCWRGREFGGKGEAESHLWSGCST